MSDSADTAKALYVKFILRDIFSLVTPGAILLTSIFYLFGSDFYSLLRLSKEMHFMFFLPFFGVFYILGIVCMSAGAFIFDNPPLPAHTRQHMVEHLTIINQFCKKTKENMDAQYLHHTFEALKQICGNNAVALFLSGIIILARFVITGFESRWIWSSLFLPIVLFIAGGILYLAYKNYLEQQEIWEDLHLGEGGK